ncbi:MAG TPA: glutamate racemase [Opitutaceae bacterium]|nr:glutamate racemase [Opitutaceae bacterium]
MIGVFDSGFGGLTVLDSLLKALPQYDYVFLADSARAPYGARSLDVIYEFTLESVEWLFDEGCTLVLLACNTASTRALRNLQQLHLPKHRPDRRVLGVVRPSVEALAGLPPGAVPGRTPPSPATGVVAVLGTESTIVSDSYGIELRKLAPHLELIQQACPLWVPLVEAGELDGPGTEWFLRRSLEPVLDSGRRPQRILLGCTHYPLLLPAIRRLVPTEVEILAQGEVVASRLGAWLERHPEQEARLGRSGLRRFVTTDDAAWFSARGEKLLGRPLTAERIRLRQSRWS